MLDGTVVATGEGEMIERGLRALYGDTYIDALKADESDPGWWIEKQHEMRQVLSAALQGTENGEGS